MDKLIEFIDTLKITEIFLDAGFTIIYDMARYYCWCDKEHLIPSDAWTIALFLRCFKSLPSSAAILNTNSKPLKPVFKKIKRVFNNRPILGTRNTANCCDTYIVGVTVKNTKYWLTIWIGKSYKKLCSSLVFSVDLLQYSRRDGFALIKPTNSFTLEQITKQVTEATVYYICKWSGDKKARDKREFILRTTKSALESGWNIPQWSATYKLTSCEDKCNNCGLYPTEQLYKLPGTPPVNKVFYICTDCLFSWLEGEAADSRYTQYGDLILDI